MDLFKLSFINKYHREEWYKHWREAEARKRWGEFQGYGSNESTVIPTGQPLTPETIDQMFEDIKNGSL